MIIRTLLTASLMAAISTAWAGEPTLPSASLKAAPDSAELLSIPAADVRSLVDEDSKAQGQAMRYGVVQRVDRALLAPGVPSPGAWQPLDDGRALWTLELNSPGAVSLDLHFSQFQLPEGAELYLADASGDYVLGPIRGSDALANGQYYTPLLPGDIARLEVVVDSSQRSDIQLVLAGVTYGYRGILGLGDHADAPRSGACNIDVACPLGDGWEDQIDSVGQYIFTRPNGSFVCTGSLIGNTGGTPIPYFITANHCVSQDSVAQTMRVYWNYQSPTCRTPGSPASGTPLPRPATFSNGASLRMTYASNDTSLVELNAPVPVAENPFFVGWDRRDLATPGNPQVSNAVTIHHPAGHEKRITLDEDALSVTTYLSNTATATGSHYRIGQWEHGTTEGGSSGSALYTPEGRLIGTLHGGYASCSSITQDWYGRIYQSWAGGGTNATRLSNWLDPLSSAPDTFDGYRGEPLPDADLAVALAATPNPVDLGDPLSISVSVENNGPDQATGVSVQLDLPAEILYTSFSGAGWSCSHAGGTVSCDLAGTLAHGADSSVEIAATVDAGALPGAVEATATVASADNDPVPGNDSETIEIQITGTADLIFANDFECAEGLDGCDIADPDIVVIEGIDLVPNQDFTGGSVLWADGSTCACDTAPYNLNIWGAGAPQFFFPNNANGSEGGVTLDNSTYAVLGSGATIGPASSFLVITAVAATSAWHTPGGVDGYLGFRFLHEGITKYGYARITTAAGGRPITLHSVTYNNAGDPITIP